MTKSADFQSRETRKKPAPKNITRPNTAKLPNDVTSRAISFTQAGPKGVEKLFELLRNKNITYRSNAKVVPSGAPFAINPAASNIVEVAKNRRISQVPEFQIPCIHIEIRRIFYLAAVLISKSGFCDKKD